MEKRKILAIVQARFESTRLRGKVLKRINKKSILQIILERLKKINKIDKIVVAISKNKNDIKIINELKKLKYDFYIGEEEDVLKRFYDCAKKYKFKNILRITSDCPLVDREIIGRLIDTYFEKKLDYCSNVIKPTYPDGLDCELFTFKALKETFYNYRSPKYFLEKEHVTLGMINSKKLNKYNLLNKRNLSKIRLTLDTKDDLKRISTIYRKFNYNFNIKFDDYINFCLENKKLYSENLINEKRNENMKLNKGQKLWQKAQKLIPGGTMLFSKNPDLYLPKKWPAYFSKSKDIFIWDTENKKFIDMSVMGLGTNLLGYSNNQVNSYVKKTIEMGTMSTLNNYEEIKLGEKLVSMHKWADMATFTRSGGEAASLAVRIARASSENNNIAICGYHGWHDWYLACNLNNKKNLNSHLMTDLPISGVNEKLKSTTFSFENNNFKDFNNVISKNKIGVVMMEVTRNGDVNKKFLKHIREQTKKKNIILIFDECTSGFRETFGGLHLKYKIYPDIAMFGKALGNGFPICAVIGKRSVMENCKKTFASSTFWTDRVGPSAAIKTLEEMEKIKSWELVTEKGLYIKENWKKLLNFYGFKFKIDGIDPLPKFNFLEDNQIIKTFITQEMLKKNVLSNNIIYLSTKHKKKYIDRYFDILDTILKEIHSKDTDYIKSKISGPMPKTGLRDYKSNEKYF